MIATEVASRRSCLAVPASSARKLEKAQTSLADEVVLDLEDAVVPSVKDGARGALVDLIAGSTWAPQISVRVNAPGTRWCHADVIALASLSDGPATLVVPKVESVGDVLFVDRLLDGVEIASPHSRRVGIQVLIESARGLSRVREIAGCSERLEALIIGYADLAASLGRTPSGAKDVGAWDSARHEVITAARANDLDAIDGPHLGIEPDDAFHAAVSRARDLGFDGKWAIHPSQIEPINELFSPTAEEIVRATQIVDTLKQAEAEDVGAIAFDGQMLDKPAELAALRVLERARRAKPL